MRTYITAALLVIVALSIYIGYQQGLFHNNLAYDDEQQGLSEQITLKFSHVVAEDTPKGQAVIKFAELVSQRSNNQINVEISPNGLLYNDNNELEALKNNKVQMIAPTLSKLTTEVPSWQLLDLPYLFNSEEQVNKVFHSSVSKELLQDLQEPNIKAMAFWQNGFKQMLSKAKPIIEVQDFKGLTVRTMPSNILRQQFTAVHAFPVNTSFDEVLTQKDNQKIDAMENTVSNIYSKNFYKDEKYLTLSNHGILAYSVLINQKFWDSLSNDQQKLIKQALKDVTNWNIKNASAINEENLANLKNENITINTLTTKQKESWQASFQPLYKELENSKYAHYLIDVRRIIKE